MLETKILLNKYKIMKKIGSGSFGKVYMAEQMQSNDKYAIKEINTSVLESNEYLYQAFWKELEIMKICECENSVCLIEQFEADGNQNIVMELCDSDLEVVLSKRAIGFNEDELRIILSQLNTVFIKMNTENVIHRDLKLKNILVKYDCKSPIGFICKLSDFGFSKVMDEDITKTKLGTPATMAPEILMNQTYNKNADLWSMGVIIYQLLFKVLPFRARNERDLLTLILNSQGVKPPENNANQISTTLNNLLQSLLQIDPNKRLDFNEYFNHPYFKKNENKSHQSQQVSSIQDKNTNREILNSLATLNIQPQTTESKKNTQISFEERFGSIRKLSDSDSEYIMYKAKDRQTGKNVCIKEISRKIIDSNQQYKLIFDKEINLLKTLEGEYFIEFIDLYTTTNAYIIITENFEGKVLDNFLKSRKTLSEQLVQNIIRQLSPVFKILFDKGIVLEFLSMRSFCFNHFISEDNFQIKFFDYGLSVIFTSEIGRRDYYLSEGKIGYVHNQKTNVLSFGLIVYRLLFGEGIYKFSLNESADETLTKQKTIKISKQISKQCKQFIEKVCHLQLDKRYDWKMLINDPFIKINYREDIIGIPTNLSSSNESPSKNKIEDSIIENLAECLKYKVELIVSYYQSLFNERRVDLEKYAKNYKEMAIFSMLTVLELRLFTEFLRPKDKFFEDEELHMIKLTFSPSTSYVYSYVNFIQNHITFNKENQMLDTYKEAFSKIENQLKEIINKLLKKIDLNIEDIQSFEYLNSNVKKYYSSNIEKYFFKLFENGIMYYSKKEYKEALIEFQIAQFFSENIIFIRLITANKKQMTSFFKLITSLENEDNFNIANEKKGMRISPNVNGNYIMIFTFLGGIFKTFKSQKILEEDEEDSSTSSNNISECESLINFYPEIIKLILESMKNVSLLND